jgi:probable HAF family extracellular repeat protein
MESMWAASKSQGLKEKIKMRIKTITWMIAIAVLTTLGTTVQLAAQEQKEEKKHHHHYRLIVVEPLGGPNSYLSGPNFQILNNRGAFAAIANTSTSNPNANCFIPFNLPDCFVQHSVVLHNGDLTKLDVLPDGANAQTTWITANGLVAGFSENGVIDPQTGQPAAVAVLWEGRKAINLGTVPGGTESIASAVNSRGQVVGVSNNDVPDATSIFGFPTQTRAFLWQNGVLRDLGTLGGPDAVASFVNDRGQVAGFSYTDFTVNPSTGVPTTHPFLWKNGKMTDLGTLGGTVAGPLIGFTFGYFNNHGELVGASNLAGDVTQHPFLWTEPEGMKDLGTLGGTFGYANWINDAREVVGIANTVGDQFLHAFLWKDGVMTDLETVGSDPSSEAKSINSRGQVVGASFDLSTANVDLHGFLWEDGGPIVDLNTLVPPGSGVTVTNAFDINDRGEIAGNGFLANGDARAVLLIPCDEDHADVEGCDFDTVDAETATQVRPAQITAPSAESSFANLSTAEMTARFRSIMARRNRRFGTPQSSPK